MNLSRRRILQLAASAALVPVTTLPSLAQSYPSRSVRWVVPFPPGGVTDIVARLIGQRLSERLGQPFVIENRAGAGGSMGTESVVRAPADGHTLLLAERSTPSTRRPTTSSPSTSDGISRRSRA